MKTNDLEISLISIFFLISCGNLKSGREHQDKKVRVAENMTIAEVGDPELNFTKRHGCSDFAVYATNPDYTEIFGVFRQMYG